MVIAGKGKKCKVKGDQLIKYVPAVIPPAVLNPAVNIKTMMVKAKECFDLAKVKKNGCNFFMFSADYPVEGCFCCDQYEPVADTGTKGKQYDIYQTCVDPKITGTTAIQKEAAAAKAANDGTYQTCFNKINLNKHNAYRAQHGAPELNKPTKTTTSTADKATILFRN